MNVQERLEKFGIVDQDTGELVIDKVAEKKSLIDAGVRLLHEIETLKVGIKEILEDAKDRGYDKKNLKALMDNVFKSEIDEKIEELRTLGKLHDIGKIAIDRSIMNKTGQLSDSEWAQIKAHPETGFRPNSN